MLRRRPRPLHTTMCTQQCGLATTHMYMFQISVAEKLAAGDGSFCVNREAIKRRSKANPHTSYEVRFHQERDSSFTCVGRDSFHDGFLCTQHLTNSLTHAESSRFLLRRTPLKHCPSRENSIHGTLPARHTKRAFDQDVGLRNGSTVNRGTLCDVYVYAMHASIFNAATPFPLHDFSACGALVLTGGLECGR